MAIPQDVICPGCKQPLISFKAADEEGLCKMVVEPNSLPHVSGILCKNCRKNSNIAIYLDNPGGSAKFVLR